jgi:ABC-2 type transport system permease protein
MGAFFFPAYLLISAMMVAVGSAVTELQQGQQVAGLLNLLFAMPFFLLALLFQNPSHPVLIGMSYFPTTSFLTISLRWGVSSIPLWQIIISWLILVATTLGMIWAASRIFRVGMLQYGQPLRFKTAVAALKRAN